MLVQTAAWPQVTAIKGKPWWPMRTALAWAVTRDDAFAQLVQDWPGLSDHDPLSAMDVAGALEAALHSTGCFDRTEVPFMGGRAIRDPDKREIVHALKPGYSGRFADLAARYEVRRIERGSLSVYQFLIGEICAAADELCSKRVSMEGNSRTLDGAMIAGLVYRAETGQMVSTDGKPETIFSREHDDKCQPGNELTSRPINALMVERDGMKSAFGDSGATASPKTKPGPTIKHAAIQAADKAEFPDGPPPAMLLKERRLRIEKKLGQKFDDKTFRKAGIRKDKER